MVLEFDWKVCLLAFGVWDNNNDKDKNETGWKWNCIFRDRSGPQTGGGWVR